MYYHVQCVPQKQLLAAVGKANEDGVYVSGAWTHEAGEALKKLCSDALLWSTQHDTPPPDVDSEPTTLNLTIREQKRLNKHNLARKKSWASGSLKWQQEMERSWKAKNLRESASLKAKVSFFLFQK